MERANLKERQKDVYDRLVAEWHAWNATMLPEIDESTTDNFTGDQLADHIGDTEVQRQGGQSRNASVDTVSGFTLFVVSSSRDLVGRALLEMKHECDA